MRAYFYCAPAEGAAQVPYQHLAVCLAEGLSALGIACYGNVDYWPLDVERRRFLIRADPAVPPESCELVVVSDDWLITGRPVPEPIARRLRDACCVALDREDGARLHTLAPACRRFDLIVRTHFNLATRYAPNFAPWAYGLSERVIAAAAVGDPPAARAQRLVANWRHTASPHSVRLAVERDVLPRLGAILPLDEAREPMDAPPEDPYERLLWRETGRRHWPQYYRRLAEARACAAFGGYFVTRWPRAKESLTSRVLKRLLARTHLRSRLVSQWDSWRMWESFAASCATIHVDLERYGCVLPVMPENWVHYIGVDLDRPQAAIDRVRDDPSILARVGSAGHAWALQHYAPVPVARRLLRLAGLAPPPQAV
jgi:hypothetical protein